MEYRADMRDWNTSLNMYDENLFAGRATSRQSSCHMLELQLTTTRVKPLFAHYDCGHGLTMKFPQPLMSRLPDPIFDTVGFDIFEDDTAEQVCRTPLSLISLY